VFVFCAPLMSYTVERKRAERVLKSWMGGDEASRRWFFFFHGVCFSSIWGREPLNPEYLRPGRGIVPFIKLVG
jgi:hypothetical protein